MTQDNRAYYFYSLLSGFIFIGAIAWLVQLNGVMAGLTGFSSYVMASKARDIRYPYEQLKDDL